MTAIPDDWVEEVRSGNLSGPPPHDPLDSVGPEMDRLEDDLALTFERSEKLGARHSRNRTPRASPVTS
jgi:hypothetical protein